MRKEFLEGTHLYCLERAQGLLAHFEEEFLVFGHCFEDFVDILIMLVLKSFACFDLAHVVLLLK